MRRNVFIDGLGKEESVDSGLDLFLVINVVMMHEVGPDRGTRSVLRWDIYDNSETHSGATLEGMGILGCLAGKKENMKNKKNKKI